VTGGPRIAGVDLDLSAASELTPTLFALAAFADAPTTLHGIGHIRGHETNRIDALIGNLEALGGSAQELADGIRIVPAPCMAACGARTTITASPQPAPSSACACPASRSTTSRPPRRPCRSFPPCGAGCCPGLRTTEPAGARRAMSWLDLDDDDDELEFDETDIRVRPNPKANRPRTKRRPAHADAVIGRVLGVDRAATPC
jgi:hypothetical protein